VTGRGTWNVQAGVSLKSSQSRSKESPHRSLSHHRKADDAKISRKASKFQDNNFHNTILLVWQTSHSLSTSDALLIQHTSPSTQMPPKQRVVLQSPAKRRQPRDGLLNNAYWELTSSENATIVRSMVVFGVSYLDHALYYALSCQRKLLCQAYF
jgi:hypothetical protein